MKMCIKCNETKSLDQFREYFKKSKRDTSIKYSYLMGECKKCEYKRVRQWERENPQKRQDCVNKWKRNNKDKGWYKKQLDVDPIKRAAIFKVHTNVKKGNLLKPNICSLCKKECSPQAHHEDYSKPLSVIWVCSTCHSLLHRGGINEFLEAPRETSECGIWS